MDERMDEADGRYGVEGSEPPTPHPWQGRAEHRQPDGDDGDDYGACVGGTGDYGDYGGDAGNDDASGTGDAGDYGGDAGDYGDYGDAGDYGSDGEGDGGSGGPDDTSGSPASPPPHRRRSRLRRGLAGAVAAAAAVAALTASQAPGITGSPPAHSESKSRHPGPWLPPGQPGDGQYHTEIPPLDGAKAPASGPGVEVAMVRQAGIPATVLAAYMRAQKRIDGSDPGCHLPWQLLAAIGKVESGQARGGDVYKNGDTRHPILGPVLNGSGFANISDTDNGRWDGDRRYDRAVGPMQFIPSTWHRWGADGNGDGVANPNNVFDAALAAGDYLCAGNRDLASRAGLERAILSYNYSRAYLRTVLSWLAFYRSGVHVVPNGTGPLPGSPGAGSAQGDPNPRGGSSPGGGGVVVGPQPSGRPDPGGSGGNGDPGTTTGGTSGGSADGGTGDGGTGDGGTGDGGTGDPGTDAGTTTGGGSGDDGGTADGGTGDGGSQSPCPSDSASPSESPSPSDSTSPSPSGSPDPCTSPAAAEGA